MKKALVIGVCVALIHMVFADEGMSPEGVPSEEAQLVRLYEATQRSLEQIRKLQENLAAFRKQEAVTLQTPEDVDALYALSQAALRLSQSIRETRLEPYFRPAFIEELSRVSKMAESKAIPPVCPH